ncbi:hypothetical protein BLNAU_11779 [Blattamonas nauphoetae]|uniref:Transmembrane protein n=1 Tax=Blattamonas nauphoetae TaxID=2049346 RepID=A0ABQ9XLL7_9EUKA|nr:hypothetical protein BLNAU_11779 [Blattamonas nauphoetae]
MTQVKNGITPSNPFPWFLPDSLVCVILILLIWRYLVPPISDKSEQFKVRIIGVVISALLLIIFLFELFANHHLSNQLSIDPNTQIPPRARIPLKTLVIAQIVFLVAIVATVADRRTDPDLGAAAFVGLLLCACAIPTVLALKGMQIISVRWIFIPLPLLVLPLLSLYWVIVPPREHEGIGHLFFAALAFLYVGVFYLIGALIADGVISWSFMVSTLPVLLPVCVVMAPMLYTS